MKPIATIAAAAILVSTSVSFAGQAKPAAPAPALAAPDAAGITPPADYVIGIGDVLAVNYFQEPSMTTDAAIVRPDGMISLPLLNDISVIGMKPEQLATRLTEMSKKTAGLVDPRVTVIVKGINSRKVYIGGGVLKGGAYDLLVPMTVLQLIHVAGLKDFVSGKEITIIRDENGKQRPLKFNLKEVQAGTKLEQNIQLKPGDTINVPE